MGSLVGQIARSHGCHVLGLTGEDAKVALCTERFGYHAAANYRSAPVAETISTLAPKGIDVLFDNVGGPILDAALRAMNVAGRVVQCGTASISSWTSPTHRTAQRTRSPVAPTAVGGFVIFDHTAHFAEALDALALRVRSGELQFAEEIQQGIQHAPAAHRPALCWAKHGQVLIFHRRLIRSGRRKVGIDPVRAVAHPGRL